MTTAPPSSPSGDGHDRVSDVDVRGIADARALELGFDPEACGPIVYRELRPEDHTYLDGEGIHDRVSLWAVYYGPPPAPPGYATAGGDLTVYIRVPGLTPIAVWVGE